MHFVNAGPERNVVVETALAVTSEYADIRRGQYGVRVGRCRAAGEVLIGNPEPSEPVSIGSAGASGENAKRVGFLRANWICGYFISRCSGRLSGSHGYRLGPVTIEDDSRRDQEERRPRKCQHSRTDAPPPDQWHKRW